MSEQVAQDQIKAFVERILRLKEEVAAINGDIREVYAEAKGNGFDKTVLGQLVSYVEKRAKDGAALAERTALFDLYLDAFDGASHTHTREAIDDAIGITEVILHGARQDEIPGNGAGGAEDEAAVATVGAPSSAQLIQAETPNEPGHEPADDDAISAVKGYARLENAAGVEPPPSNPSPATKGGQHDHGGEHVRRSDDEQRDAARVPRSVGRGEGADEGAEGQGAGASGSDRLGGAVAGTRAGQDQDGRSGDVGREARHEVVIPHPVEGTTPTSTADGDRGAVLPSAATVVADNSNVLPTKKRWTFNDPAHGDCLDPAMCGGFSNLKRCQKCVEAAAVGQVA